MPEPIVAPVVPAAPAPITAPVAPAPVTAPVAPAPAILNTPPAPGTPAPPATTVSPGTGTPASTAWTEGMSEELKGYVTTKGFKDSTAVIQSYQNLEKLMGVPRENLLSLPEKADSPDWQNVYKRLGKPEKAADYKITVPEGADETFSNWARESFHELNLTANQAETLSAKWNDFMTTSTKEHTDARTRELDQQESGLRTEWGNAYDKNVNDAKKAAHAIGLDATKVEQLEGVLGFDGLMKMMHGIGSKFMTEGSFEISNSTVGAGTMTPAQAQNAIATAKQDPDFVKNYTEGRAAEKDKMAYWHSMAHPEAAPEKVLK